VTLTAEKSLLERLGHERFDLILVDWMIHSTSLNEAGEEIVNVHFEGVSWHKTGLEFLRRLRQGEFSQENGTPANVPAIVLSAVADNALEGEAARELSVAKYVEKPYRLNELADLICKLLQEP
jgi:CheY-like chemotaxis protein